MLLAWGHSVYDFQHEGFSWGEIWPDYYNEPIPSQSIIDGLKYPRAEEGYKRDLRFLNWCDCCILLMPCGNSAHAEFGYACGLAKKSVVLLPYNEFVRPDLMWKFADLITKETDELRNFLND